MRLGVPLQLRLSLGARHAAQSAEELEVSLGRLVGITRVEVTVEGQGVERQALHMTLTPVSSQHSLLVSLETPVYSSHGTTLNVRAISVLGKPVALPLPPLCIPGFRGIVTPLQLNRRVESVTTPCISPEGHIYCPPGDGPEVLMFDSDGTPLPGVSVASIGLSIGTAWAAYARGVHSSLLLADWKLRHPAFGLVSVDPTTRAPNGRQNRGPRKRVKALQFFHPLMW